MHEAVAFARCRREPGSVAAVALIEHLWAGPLVEAIASAGGRPLSELWLSPEDRARLPG